jgi:hypothetical protein
MITVHSSSAPPRAHEDDEAAENEEAEEEQIGERWFCSERLENTVSFQVTIPDRL